MSIKNNSKSSSGRKVRQEEWITCRKTQFIYHVSADPEHQSFLSTNLRGVYTRITSQGLSGLLIPISSSSLTFDLPSSILQRSLFVSKGLLKAFDLHHGSSVLYNQRCVLYIWSHTCLSSSSYVHAPFLSELLKSTHHPHHQEESELCTLEPFIHTVAIAKEVRLSSEVLYNFMSSSTFRSSLKAFLQNIVLKSKEYNSFFFFYYGKTLNFSIASNPISSKETETNKTAEDSHFVVIVPETKIILEGVDQISEKTGAFNLRNVFGGYESTLDVLENVIKGKKVRGILLWGPSGTGKSLIGKHIGVSCNFVTLVLDSLSMEPIESQLGRLFEEASSVLSSNCIIFIDDLDSVICQMKKKNNNNGNSNNGGVCLSKYMDSFSQVLVVGATSKPEELPSILRRPGRFDLEIEIGVPDSRDRREILRKKLQNIKDEEIELMAERTHGFVGADLEAFAREFDLCKDVLRTLSRVQPSAMREISLSIPSVSWADIAGNEDLKLKLRQAVEWPLKHPEVFSRMGIRSPKGILMYGPPGCSKTMIAKALANESGLNFMAIKGPELFSKWVGDSEKAVRDLFRKARSVAPSIIFFDEIDALGSSRGTSSSRVGDRVLAQLLTEMDGIESLESVTIVGATNRPELIDSALLRPGRLDRVIYVPLPSSDTRRDILKLSTKRSPIFDVNFESVVERTKGYSGAELVALCNEAALKALEESLSASVITQRHFESALSVIKPRISSEDLQIYKVFGETHTFQTPSSLSDKLETTH